ncbi:uncharacterized protein A4U43_C09F11410 [Asparagus officinalis]|uniref:Bifunctional inhibitor/plant lipid transfer protein/seed storage helical domain-containing protein n=2 Tax=Asparagus officinalis TaxID=4686 RepID=A0A5P1EBS1_ASPOF|nr:uncharacterized protein A4U43_C09F11410 [Asparagus officinalis]
MPGMDCMNALLNLSSCLTYVEAGSNLTVPETGGVKIDTSKALMLPKACKVQTPPVSLCSAVGVPVASPMGPSAAPASGGPEVPGSTPIAAPAGSTSGNTARATSTLVTLISLLLTLAIFF